jgi:hypothetical protein
MYNLVFAGFIKNLKEISGNHQKKRKSFFFRIELETIALIINGYQQEGKEKTRSKIFVCYCFMNLLSLKSLRVLMNASIILLEFVVKEKNDKYASSVHTSNRMPFIHRSDQ